MVRFDHTLESGTYSFEYEFDADVDSSGRDVVRLVFAGATDAGGVALNFDQLVAREDATAGGEVDVDALEERLKDAAQVAAAAWCSDGEPDYDLDAGFDAYAGAYSDDC